MQLVLDWDGTVTEVDTLHQVIARFGDLDVFRAMEAELGRRLTLHEVIEVEMATVRTPLAEVVPWLLEHARVRPGFAALAAAFDPVIVSAGFHELIDPLLEREGVRLRVVANRVVSDGPDGWHVAFRSTMRCEVCGEPCKREAAAGLAPYAYVGDGVSDRCVSLAAERRFARDGLAAWLDGRGLAYERFEDFDGLAAALSRDAR